MHHCQLTDPYQWLEDKNDPEVLEWTKKQHDSTLEYVKKGCATIDGLEEELRAYLDRDIVHSPMLRGSRIFFYAIKKGEPQMKLYTRIEGKEDLIFDPTKLDPSGKTSISEIAFTKSADRVAIGVQYKGAEISTYYIIDTLTGEQLGDPIEGLRGFSWTYDEQHAYVTVGTQEMLENQEPIKTYLHKIGSDRATDIFLIAPKDTKDFAYYYDEKYSDLTFIHTGDFYSTTLKMRTAGTQDEPIEVFSSKQYKATPHAIANKIYFYTNHEAPNFKLMVADREQPTFENWKELYGEKDTMLVNYKLTKDYLIIQDKKDVQSRLIAYDLEGNFMQNIALPEAGNVVGMSYHKTSNTVLVWLSTFTSPVKVYKLNGTTLEWNLFYEGETPLDTSQMESKLVFYPSKDGTKVPMFLVYKKGLKLDGTNPTMLYGYGGFNAGIEPTYIGTTASFINRGGIFARAGIRGGDEYGEQWHLDGMRFKKQNTFDDFIAAAEYLIAEKYTNPQKLAIKGGSNGGLLIGAMVAQRPDLFKTAICAVPLLDMIRYHKFLIARYWIPEYGDPENEADFRYLLTYSPYHNIRQGINIPTTLFIAGENDVRVDPLHAKKMVAALQNNIGQIDPMLLYIDYDSGHGSGKSIDQMVENLEFEWRFMMWQLGME